MSCEHDWVPYKIRFSSSAVQINTLGTGTVYKVKCVECGEVKELM